MSRHFFELAVRARRLVTRTGHPLSEAARSTRLTARRQLGNELTQFSFRLAFVIDIAYVGLGGLAGAAVARATTTPNPGRLCAESTGAIPNVSAPGQRGSTLLPPGIIR
jgi:hypothetical protein